MFNNIIYFIIVLLLFNISLYDGGSSDTLLYSITMIALFWALYAFICWLGFRRLIRLYERGNASGYAAIYSGLVFRLSISAIIIFSIDLFSFNLRGLIELIPFAGSIYILQGLSALIIFIIYLSTMWYFAHPAYNMIFGTDIGKRGFITGNIRFNIPVIFPWLMLSIVSDIIEHTPLRGFKRFLDQPSGQIIFMALFLTIILIFIPVIIKYFWGCKPLPDSSKASGVRAFLKSLGFKYKEIVNWPLLEGKMMTAGIMGIVPGYRYIMITDSLMEILTQSELNAVMAHEAGHAKYKHQIKLSLLFVGFFILAMGIIDSDYYSILIGYVSSKNSFINMSDTIKILLFAGPLILSLILYFRFIMGFFMRHFERQADSYAAITLNDPMPIISSLEKIALLSGKIRDVPSWHHFSIRQRVEFLLKSNENPWLFEKHRRMVASSLVAYLTAMLFISSVFFINPVKNQITYSILSFIIKKESKQSLNDVELMMNIAMVYNEMKKVDEAKEIYEKIIVIDRKQDMALNNLAWLLITAQNPDPGDIKRGYELAKEAVNIKRSPEYLDTLAEACFLLGKRGEAIRLIKEAIMLDKRNPHYRKQYERFTDKNIIYL
jgi:Zn-dependent protease with chaperone function